MSDEGIVDHDLLIRIDENVKEIRERCSGCRDEVREHDERLSALEGDMKAVHVRHGVWSAVAVAVSGAVSAALRWWK